MFALTCLRMSNTLIMLIFWGLVFIYLLLFLGLKLWFTYRYFYLYSQFNIFVFGLRAMIGIVVGVIISFKILIDYVCRLYLFSILFMSSICCIVFMLTIIFNSTLLLIHTSIHPRSNNINNPQILNHPIPNLLSQTPILPQHLLHSPNITTINSYNTNNINPHLHIIYKNYLMYTLYH